MTAASFNGGFSGPTTAAGSSVHAPSSTDPQALFARTVANMASASLPVAESSMSTV